MEKRKRCTVEPLGTDTSLIRTLCSVPSVSVAGRLDCVHFYDFNRTNLFFSSNDCFSFCSRRKELKNKCSDKGIGEERAVAFMSN